ncbi:M56 family metallopeptidase [Rathayibacter sp. YIM 133350]|uniref:M56 family metallopeptidase n=1 Tax=Rathayibacter sp. YIM 133350 TaxID=3131992 RepID=UPI00307F94E2
MLLASGVLAALAVALAWPVPVALSRAQWPTRSPGVALALWQAIALGGGLSMIGALLGFGLAPAGGDLPAALGALAAGFLHGPLPVAFGALHLFLLSAAVLLALDLLLNLADTAIRTERERRRHRELVTLLSTPSADAPRTHVLDHPAPMAYCLPGVRTQTVLSNGLIGLLDAKELQAVLAHEQTHLRQYHHLVLLAFRAWRNALPWFPIANRAERAVAVLVELLADDDARRRVDRATLSNAILKVGTSWEAPDASGGASTVASPDAEVIRVRVRRLASDAPALSAPAVAAVLAIAALLVAFPAAFMLSLVF